MQKPCLQPLLPGLLLLSVICACSPLQDSGDLRFEAMDASEETPDLAKDTKEAEPDMVTSDLSVEDAMPEPEEDLSFPDLTEDVPEMADEDMPGGEIEDQATFCAQYDSDRNLPGGAQCTLQENGQCNGGELPEADLSCLNLYGQSLSQAQLRRSRFVYSDLRSARFFQALISQGNFTRASLERAIFSGSDLTEATFANADLTNVNFTGVDAPFTNFRDTACVRTNFTSATLRGADFSGATLERVNFTSADLREADLRTATFGDNIVWLNTTCPDGTNSQDHDRTCINNLNP